MRSSKFTRVADAIWERNGLFYLQTNVPGRGCRRVRLPGGTLEEAQRGVDTLRTRLKAGKAAPAAPKPCLAGQVAAYIDFLTRTRGKDQKTIAKEAGALAGWLEFLGDLPLDSITRAHVNDYVCERCDDVSNRTVNLDVIALNNLYRWSALTTEVSNPCANWKPLKHTPPERRLIERSEIETFCAVATSGRFENGQAVADWVKFMAFSGARRSSALASQWFTVDWNMRQIRLLKTKYGKTRVYVDFNRDLEAHLIDMKSRAGNNTFLFPNGESHFGSLQKSFAAIRKAAGTDFNPHDLRHFFASWSVMSGVDTKTVAQWLGHSDGGVLVARRYGHLSPGHAARMATRVEFHPVETVQTEAGQPSAARARLATAG